MLFFSSFHLLLYLLDILKNRLKYLYSWIAGPRMSLALQLCFLKVHNLFVHHIYCSTLYAVASLWCLQCNRRSHIIIKLHHLGFIYNSLILKIICLFCKRQMSYANLCLTQKDSMGCEGLSKFCSLIPFHVGYELQNTVPESLQRSWLSSLDLTKSKPVFCCSKSSTTTYMRIWTEICVYAIVCI